MSILLSSREKRTPSDIKSLISKARRILKHPGLDILSQATPEGKVPFLVVITPGHIADAVDRNKARRRIRSIFRENDFLKKQSDFVVFVKKKGPLLSFAELKALILDALLVS